MAGYSGTPLVKKLGIKAGDFIKVINAPDNYISLLTDIPENVHINKHNKTYALLHYFTTSAMQLEKDIILLKNSIQPNGIIWISWPKKTSKMPTDVTENIIREIALNNGLVDVKVCAVDEIWSGLKLVIPLKNRR